MEILTEKRCIIGEGPIWNEKQQTLYFTNGFGGNQICTYNFKTKGLNVRPLPFGVAAFAFDTKNRLIVSHYGGVHILNEDNSLTPIYDTQAHEIACGNDMKAGPDGAIYVGTQSRKNVGVSDAVDGKLYRISPKGEVTVLLDDMICSNGMDWSLDEKKFYHTDSATCCLKEYDFDKKTGKITFTGRHVRVEGIDGLTIGLDNRLYIACWGQRQISVVDTETMQIVERLPMPCNAPASCGFCGENMDILAITTASYLEDCNVDINAGFTILKKMKIKGRKPYYFGEKA